MYNKKNKRDSKHCIKHIKYNFNFLSYPHFLHYEGREKVRSYKDISLKHRKNLILVPIERFSVV